MVAEVLVRLVSRIRQDRSDSRRTGLERVVFLFLKLGNIRWASLYPRDPRSFPRRDKEVDDIVFAPADGDSLRGPAVSTLQFVKKRDEGEHPPMPTLAQLIPAYGDSAATSWFDPFWAIWQHQETGAICGQLICPSVLFVL